MERSQVLRDIIDNVERVIIGKRKAIELTLCALLCRGHVLVEDVPGVGKTSLVTALAKSLDLSFKRIQFTPDILPSDIVGFSVYNQRTGEFEHRSGAIMSQIILADEINRTSPKTQSSLLEAMEEAQVTVDGVTYPLPEPFMVLATQNPIEYLGTYPLPEAQLDRFFMKITIGYPDKEEEAQMLDRFKLDNPMKSLRPVTDAKTLMDIQNQVSEVYVDFSVNEYIVEIIGNTRRNRNVVLGASPRAGICLYKASQAWAYYKGRDFVTPDDVYAMAPHVLNHRMILGQESRFKKVTTYDVVNEALNQSQGAKVSVR